MDRRFLGALIVVVVVIISAVSAGLLLRDEQDIGRSQPPVNTASAWVDLTALSSGTVRSEDRWGSMETFAEAATGTLSWYHQVSLVQSANSESVVLDGKVWCLLRGNVTDQVLLRYKPQVQGDNWNYSVECYAPQAGNAFDPSYGEQRIGLTASLVNGQGDALAAVNLSYGTPGNNRVSLTQTTTGEVTTFAETMLPSTTIKDGSEGKVPDRYIISFQRADDVRCVVTVLHTSGVLVGQGTVDLPPGWTPAQLVLASNSTVLTRIGIDSNAPTSATVYAGGWVVDNLACRGATARYPMAGPSYEYCVEGAGSPEYNASRSSAVAGAVVTIGGVKADFNGTSGRYEAVLDLRSQWGMAMNYSVEMDGMVLHDTMDLTMISSANHAAVSQWWNGWDWASVFGQDDSNGARDIMSKYKGYAHPLTSYVEYPVSSEGGAKEILTYPYVEIGLHNPHDWEGGALKVWNRAVSDAGIGLTSLRNAYDFASRWDDPDRGGKGDTYISMANPGNKASYEMLYALYLAGIRIDGRSSDLAAGAAGNHTQLGSWYDIGGYLGTGGGWDPYQVMDLMDAARSLSWDNAQSWNSTFALVSGVAENHGVLRAYGHPGKAIAIPEMMHWIDDDKTNYTLENWKATDGEVASYIYGRWSTEVIYEPTSSAESAWTYSVIRPDASTEGYWNVPITIEVDLGGREVKDVLIDDGEHQVSKGLGTLKDLEGGRIMDVGYDIRDGKLYVSYIWSENSELTVTFVDGDAPAPDAITAPLELMRTEESYIPGATSEKKSA